MPSSWLFAQHTVSCPYTGLPLPPALRNVFTTFSSGSVLTRASPILPASSEACSPLAATAMNGSCLGTVKIFASSTVKKSP